MCREGRPIDELGEIFLGVDERVVLLAQIFVKPGAAGEPSLNAFIARASLPAGQLPATLATSSPKRCSLTPQTKITPTFSTISANSGRWMSLIKICRAAMPANV
jgi:hypothetical protein